MKCLFKLIIVMLICIVLVVGAVLGGYFYIKNTYGIDLVKTIQELAVLTQSVDEDLLAPNKFDLSDMVDVQSEVNQSVENMITFVEQNGYSVNFDNLPDEMKTIIKLTDKEIGAFTQTVIKQEYDNKLGVGDKNIGINLVQIDFAPVDGKVSFNAVVKLSVDELKSGVSDDFPFGYLKSLIPNDFYVSSTVLIDRNQTPFNYTVEHLALTINNLSNDQTADLFHTLDVLLGIGSSENLNLAIGNMVVGSLIGGDSIDGLAYALKDIGASDYAFTFESEGDYFSVLR